MCVCVCVCYKLKIEDQYSTNASILACTCNAMKVYTHSFVTEKLQIGSVQTNAHPEPVAVVEREPT